MDEMLKIFTPTFNRANKLSKLKKSLANQTNKNFEWLIVDDGSTDDTKKRVDEWIVDSDFKIKYIYKDNGGKHTAFNVALDEVSKYLNVCVDSDDWVSEFFVDAILSNHRKNSGRKDIIAYAYPRLVIDNQYNDKIYSEGIKVNSWKVSAEIPGIKETIRIFKPNILNNKRFKIFKGEKFQPETFLFSLVANEGEMLYFPQQLVFGELLMDGLSNNYKAISLASPNGVILSHYVSIQYLSKSHLKTRNKEIIKNIIQLQAIGIAAKKNPFKESPKSIFTPFLLPVSYIYYIKNYRLI